jgi:TolA-binding protein
MTAKALARIGECHLKKGDLQTAQGFFKQSIETFPEDEVLAYNVGEIYFNQKLDEATEYFAMATGSSPAGAKSLQVSSLYLNKADYAKRESSARSPS